VSDLNADSDNNGVGNIVLANNGNDFGGAVDAEGHDITLRDSNNILFSDVNDANGDALIATGDVVVEAQDGSITQTERVSIAGTSDLDASENIVLSNFENEFVDAVDANGMNVTLSVSSDLILNEIITDTTSGVFDLTTTADVTQSESGFIDTHEFIGSATSSTVTLFNTGNQIDEIGDFTVSGGADLFLRDSGRRDDSDTTIENAGLIVTGNVGVTSSDDTGTIWLVVDAQDENDQEGLTVTGTVNVAGENESLVLIGGLNDGIAGLEGFGELVIAEAESNRVTVTSEAQAHLVINTTTSIVTGSDLSGVDLSGGAFNSLNPFFNGNPVSDVDFGVTLDELSSDSFVLADLQIDFSEILPSGAPTNNPSAIYTHAAGLFTDTEVGSLFSSEFFEQLGDAEALTIGFSPDVLGNDKQGSGFNPVYYGPYSVTYYEHDLWSKDEEDTSTSRESLTYKGYYPLYLYKDKKDYIPGVDELERKEH